MKTPSLLAKTYFLSILCVGLALAIPHSAVEAADGDLPSLPWKNAELQAGLFVPLFQSDVQLDSDVLGNGTKVDLEDDLGLDKEIFSYRVDGYWRVFPRHTLAVSYYDLSRDADSTITRTIQVGDTTFTAGADVSTKLDLRVLQANYGYSFIHNQKFDMAAKLGVYLADMKFRISSPGLATEEESLLAPLPVLGLQGSYAITPRIFASAGANVFFVEYGEYSGSLVDAKVTLDFDLTDNLGLGLGYNHNFINIERDSASDAFDVDFNYGAFMLYLRLFL